MPGTILLDDLRSSIGDELRSHAQGLLQLGQGAVQSINDAIPTPPPVPQGPDPNQILQELQQHAQQAAAAAQPALQVLGNAGQAAGGAVTQLGQARDQVNQQLQDHVASITQGAQDAVQSLAVPKPPTLGTAAGDVTAPDHEPSPPLQTPGTQIANTPDASGRVFPLTIKPDNNPSATYHSQGGSDLMAPRGTPVLSMQRGTVEEVFTDNGSHTVGGNAVLVHGDDGLDYYYAHFDQPSAVKVGQRVEAGEQIGAVGNSGNAFKGGEGATHLHIGIGHGISNGVGSEGGLGQNFNAQSLLTDLESGVGQAAGAARTAVQQVAGDLGARVGQGQKDFVTSLLPMAQRVAQQTGIDPNAMLAIAANETGWGQSSNAQQQNNLFSLQGDGSNGSRWASYKSPQESFNAFVNLIQTAPRYAQAWADRGNAAKFIDDLRNAGYVVDEPGYPAQGWVDQVKSIYGNLPAALGQDQNSGVSPQRQAALGGTGGAQNAVLTMGDNQPAKAPLVVGGQGFSAGPTPIQSAADVLGGAAGAVGGAIGGAASALGSAAQGALAQATAPVQLQPGQVSARDQVNQVASDVQQAAQGVLGAAQDVNRLTPGTSAVNAVAPVLGAAASDLGTTARGVVDAAAPVLGGALQDENAQALAFAQSPIGHRLLQAAAENAQEGPSLIPAGTMSLYRDVMQVKNDWLEQNNPLNNLPGARPEPGHEGDITPGGLIAGLTTGIAQQFTDPLMLALLGPTSGVAEAGTGALSGAVSRIVGPQLAERLSPGAVSVLGTIAQKFSQGAIVGGLQNAMFEAEKKTSTPESVGQALVVGAGLGGVIDVGSVPVMAVVRRIGQVLLDNAPQISEALRSRQPAETNVNNALGGVPEMIARARGEGEPTGGFAAPERAVAQPSGVSAPTTDVTSQMGRNFLRDTVSVPKSDPRPMVQDIGSAYEKLVHQNDLTDVVPAGTTVLYHETSVPNARALLDRIESGPRNQTPIFTSDNRDLALGQGGKGVMLEFNPARANGSVAPQKPGLTLTAATGGGQEYTVSRTLPGAVSAIVVRTERQAAQLATNARVARRFDFANAEPTADGGIRIPRRETGTAMPAAAAVVTPRVAPEPTGFRAPETGVTSEPVANPFALHTEPAPGRVPLNDEDIATHVEDLASRYEANDARIQQLQDLIANKGKGEYSGNIVRPSWAIGWSDDALRALAKREGLNPNDPTWGSRAQDAAYQSGLKGTGTTPLTPPQARAEIARLAAENEQLLGATDIPEGATTLYRGAPQAATELPFDRPYTAPDDAAGANPSSARQDPATAPGSVGAAAPVRATEPGAVPTSGAAEPAARAESAQSELTGFRAPESSAAEPVARTEAGQPEGTGFRPPSSEAAPRAAGVQQRVSPAGEVLSRTTGQPVAPAASELAGNIRLPKFVQQPVADIIQQVHDADPARFEAARRGVVTDQMVRDLAEEAGTTVNRVAAAWKPGKAANAETTLALRTALADRALRVRSAQNLLRLNPASIDARNTLVEALNQHAALQEVVAGVTGEAGRVVRQFRQPVTGEQASLSALQRMAKNARMSPEELAGHLTNVDLSDPQAVASLASTLTTHSFADKAQALWYFNLLSSPVTWMKNGISNALVLASRPIESLAAAGIDAGRAGLTGTDRQRFMGEAPAEIFGMAHGLGPGLQDAFRAMRTGITRRELENPELAGRMEPFSGRLADLTVNVPGRVLSATDALFRTMNEQASIYKLAYRQAAQEGTSVSGMTDRIAEILRNPDQRLLDEAKAEGAYRIFQNPNAVGKAALQVREALPFGTGRFLMPFVNTPVNVGAYALERSPLAAAKLVGSAAERSGGQLSDNIARMTLGTALAGFAALQGAQGNITGAAPTDPTERDAWEREGKQPYSIHAPNGVWYSYGAMQPFSTLIAAGAAAGDAWKKGQNDPTTGLNPASLIAITGAAAGRAIIDQPWLQGLAGLVDMLTSSSQPGQPSDPMKQISVNAQRALASGVVPAGVRLLARAFDPTTRTSDPGFEGFGQALAAGIPGLTDKAPARLGAFGQPIQRPGGSGPSVLNPFTPSPETNDPVEKELRRLQDGGYDVEPSLAGKRVTLIGEAIGLTPDQQRQYQTLSGVMTHDLLSSLLATDAYKSLPSDKQALVINRLGDRVADAARKTLYPTLLDQAVAKKVAELQSRQQNTRPGLAPEEFVTRRATGSADAPTGAAPTGSANITVNQEAAA